MPNADARGYGAKRAQLLVELDERVDHPNSGHPHQWRRSRPLVPWHLCYALSLRQSKEVIPVSDVFNTLLEIEGRDAEFARAYAAESARIEAIDSVINALDAARGTERLTKAALARAIGSDPSTVRRLLSSDSANPTLGTVAEVAAALGMKVTLVPMSTEDRVRITEPMRAAV